MDKLELKAGAKIVLYCCNYFYAGVVECADDSSVLLAEARIVYDTGDPENQQWELVRRVGHDGYWRVARQAIESWGSAEGMW